MENVTALKKCCLLLEDDSKGSGSFETGYLAGCGEKLKETDPDENLY